MSKKRRNKDYKIVWNIAKKELPKLRKQVKEILKQEAD
jgi:uncharacterized protein with HEPN domain